MNSRDRFEEYLICKERGHVESGVRTASIPPQSICAKCGTYYWYTEPEIREGNVPDGDEGDEPSSAAAPDGDEQADADDA